MNRECRFGFRLRGSRRQARFYAPNSRCQSRRTRSLSWPELPISLPRPWDVADGNIVVGEPVECPSPAAAIRRAEGLWKILGHTGAVAFSRTGDQATGDFVARKRAIFVAIPMLTLSAVPAVGLLCCDFRGPSKLGMPNSHCRADRAVDFVLYLNYLGIPGSGFRHIQEV
jgi:hypothetical protein